MANDAEKNRLRIENADLKRQLRKAKKRLAKRQPIRKESSLAVASDSPLTSIDSTRKRDENRHRASMNQRRIDHILKGGGDIGGVSMAEQAFCIEAELAGYEIYRAGWPDFLIHHPEKGTHLVEVKSPTDAVHDSQVRMFSALERAGISVKVYMAGEIGRERFRPWQSAPVRASTGGEAQSATPTPHASEAPPIDVSDASYGNRRDG